MTGPNSKIYRNRAKLEDMLALLVEAEERRKCIFVHAFHESDWNTVFDEARFQGQALSRLADIMRRSWCDIQGMIDEAADD